MKLKLGKDIYESWLKKMDLIEVNSDNLLISVPTRFIRDWITSRYLDQILQVIKLQKKNINRIEFIIKNSESEGDKDSKTENSQNIENVSFIKDS